MMRNVVATVGDRSSKGAKQRLLGLAIVLALGSGCAGTEAWERNKTRLDNALLELDAEELETTVQRMNTLLAETEGRPSSFSLQRFYASYLLAQAHTAASLGAAFYTEATVPETRIGGIGQRTSLDVRTSRPSTTGHLVAAVYHASMARSMYDRAARSGPKHKGATLIPESLWNLGVDNADANLQLILTAAYARLGFLGEVDKILERSPDLTELESCLAFLDQYGVQTKLKPWICAMIFEFMKTRDEKQAYRFGVSAVEGEERFSYALPEERVSAIERWIETESKLLFVCPESETPYIPGERKSPISGVPHMDYVGIERPSSDT